MDTTFDKKRVLITGGLGFIGSNLAFRLADLGAELTLMDSLVPEYGGTPLNIRGLEDRVKVNISDVRDVHGLRWLLRGQDYLFNLAGQTSHLDSMQDPYTDLDINCKSQLALLECCREVNPGIRIVFASTRQIYGRPEYLPVDEAHPLRPTDVNGVNKMAGESYHMLYNAVYGIQSCVLRLTNTIGPRMRIRDARQTFVGVWIRKVLEGKPFEVWGGGQLRDFTYVDDCVDALLAAAGPRAAGKVFNLGGLGVVSLSQLADMLLEAAGRGEYLVRPFPAEREKIDIGDYYSDGRLIAETLGWKPATSVREALAGTLAYFSDCWEEYCA
jgi:UDP-glucose 4-epimerase